VFTGIVEEIGEVVALEAGAAGARIAVRAPQLARLAAVGDSIAVSGCCLTVVGRSGDVLGFDAVPETLARTALVRLAPGEHVNLEDAIRAGEPFGGHILQGHVDGVGVVAALEQEGDGHRLVVQLPPELARYVVHKGSIGVDGVSLTVAALRPDAFEVALIPHTWEATTLSQLAAGARVNLEVDIIAKHVERLLAASNAAPEIVGSPA
jgi:riboflavin synthase